MAQRGRAGTALQGFEQQRADAGLLPGVLNDEPNLARLRLGRRDVFAKTDQRLIAFAAEREQAHSAIALGAHDAFDGIVR